MVTLPIYHGNKVRQVHKARAGDYLQRAPEFIFEAYARLVVINDNRALYDS
jgi:hypothetical protein